MPFAIRSPFLPVGNFALLVCSVPFPRVAPFDARTPPELLCFSPAPTGEPPQALEHVGLDEHFAPDRVVDADQMRARRQGSKTACVLEVRRGRRGGAWGTERGLSAKAGALGRGVPLFGAQSARGRKDLLTRPRPSGARCEEWEGGGRGLRGMRPAMPVRRESESDAWGKQGRGGGGGNACMK